MKTTIHRCFCWSAVFILFLLTSLSWAAQLDNEFQARLNAMNENETITVLVFIKEQANLRAVRGNPARVLSTLHETSQRSQKSVLDLVTQLKALGQVTEVQNFWIINGLSITGTKKAILTLASNDTIAWIRESKTITIPPAEVAPRILAGPMAVEWNISKINVPQVWSTFGFRGEGITVASIDTGVDANHPDLLGRMGQIGDGGLGWFDAVNGQSSPYDDIGHGTHVTGTMVGGNSDGTDIGIVPNAHYYMAKAFDPDGGPEVAITAAAQWMMDPDCNPATDDFPDIINNSWGGEDPNDTWFESIYQSWEAVGIFSAFSAGNAGPGASTISDPGGYPEVLAVGATTSDDEIANFSSRGPVYWQDYAKLNPPTRTVIKPDVSAPGASIRSSIPGGGYESWNGTSMATPHVNGTAALMLQAAPSLTPAEIKDILCSTAVDLGDSGKDNNFGCGCIDAFEAVNLVATGGTLTGTVTGDGVGLARATVEVVSAVTTTTDNNGHYTVMVAAGSYTVHASKIGYLTQEVSDVVITEDETTTLDFPLEPVPSGTVSGTVIASNRDGQPLAATIYVVEIDFSDNTNPDDGSYSIRLPAGTYTFQVSTHAGYRPASASVEVIADENIVQNSVLKAYDAYEENNSLDLAKAWPIELGIPLTEGTIEPAEDHDYFKFNGEAGQVITIDVDADSLNLPSSLDSELYLYNSDGDQLFYNDDYDGSDSRIVEFPLPSDDIYYVMVRDYESLNGGPEYFYHLKVDLDGLTNVDSYEPNNDFEHATGIIMGSSLSEAIINPEGDYDYFKFKGSAEQVITIDVDANSLNPPSSLDSELYLYNSGGEELAYNDDYDGSDSRIVGFRLPSDDTYYLLVKDYDNKGGESYFYTLYLSLTAPINLVAKSGQDYRIPLTWNSLTADYAPAKSPTLDETGLHNFIGYNVHRGMTPGGPYNPVNNEPISVTSYTDETVENGINYYYVVTGIYSNGMGTEYSNEAVAQAGPLDINEPNDTPATATSLAMGETAVALIQVARDVDYYAFEASVGQGIVLDVDTDEYSHLDSVLSLIALNAESDEVVLVTNDDYDGTDSRIEYVTESAGTYYAKVEGYSPSYGVEYTYSLRLTWPEPPQNLQAVGLDGVVELTWMPPEEIHYVPAKKPSSPVVPNDLIGYKLYRSEVSGGLYEQIGTIIEDSFYTDANVQNGVTYYYVVTAIRSESGESRYSNEASATPQIRYGDVSNDGSISPYDASLILQSVVGLKELDSNEFEKADVTDDGEVTAFDAALVMRYIVGLIDKFPAEGGSGASK